MAWKSIWDAITKPESSDRYGYGGFVEYDLRPGGAFRVRANDGMRAFGAPDVIVDGEVVEADTPRTAALVAGSVDNAGGGWSWVLSDLKTLLETGERLDPSGQMH